eukprot:PhM_4_TR16867/c0_g2_i1/m.39560
MAQHKFAPLELHDLQSFGKANEFGRAVVAKATDTTGTTTQKGAALDGEVRDALGMLVEDLLTTASPEDVARCLKALDLEVQEYMKKLREALAAAKGTAVSKKKQGHLNMGGGDDGDEDDFDSEDIDELDEDGMPIMKKKKKGKGKGQSSSKANNDVDDDDEVHEDIEELTMEELEARAREQAAARKVREEEERVIREAEQRKIEENEKMQAALREKAAAAQRARQQELEGFTILGGGNNANQKKGGGGGRGGKKGGRGGGGALW